MIFNANKLWARVLFTLALSFGISSQAAPFNVARSDILLHIATQCVDPSTAKYCANCMFPRVDASCGDILECKKTNEVWALTNKYAVIRDIKMCGCPASFVHALAMPRDVVTGVEDPSREEGIWQFAWDVGLKRIESNSLILAVNPKSERTQNQLHVHILMMDKGARANFETYSHAYVQNLEQVWSVSQKIALSLGLSDYGVLVAKESANRYIVVVTTDSPEAVFTVWNCSDSFLK